MRQGLLLKHPPAGWAKGAFADLYPGAHVAVFGGFRTPLEAEDAGFEVRDSLLVVGPVRHQIWLLRKPYTEPTLAAQLLSTGTGGINIDGCRIGGGAVGRFPMNFMLMHMPGCKPVRPREESVGTQVAFIDQEKASSPSLGRRYMMPIMAPRPITTWEWECLPGCAALSIDQQSGIFQLQDYVKGILGEWDHETGGASRFLQQFRNEEELDEWLTRLILPS